VIQAKELLWSGAGSDAPSFEQDDTGSEKQGFAEIVSDEDDGLAEAASEGAEFTLELRAGDGIERAEGLVHEQNGRIGRKGAGNADALTLAAGEFAGAATREFAGIETDKLEHFLDAGGGAGGVPVFQSGDEGDIFCDGEMGEEAGVLNDVTDAAAEADGVPSSGRAALNEDFAL
jgi:hypothetical protein